jgi:hypothetical protein
MPAQLHTGDVRWQAAIPLDLSASEAHSCECPFGSPANHCLSGNISVHGRGRMDNLLKVHN